MSAKRSATELLVQGKTQNVERLSELEFIEHLRTEIRAGFGLTPFVGSGCSSTSGILMGQEFSNYLAYVVFVCVASPEYLREARPEYFDETRSKTTDPIPKQRLNLRKEGWPRFPAQEVVAVARKWVFEEYGRVCDQCGIRIIPEREVFVSELRSTHMGKDEHPANLAKILNAPLLPQILRGADCNIDDFHVRQLHTILGDGGIRKGGIPLSGVSPTSWDAIAELAVRSLYDWRATLNFLSELVLTKNGTLMMDKPDPSIIDRFNRHITSGRKPNFTHTMLCHLAGPARFRTILTTNFDKLIESAFEELHADIQCISVSNQGFLPHPELVHARNTVVKLHGTFNDTRADFSLDDSPSLEDKRNFFHYIRGCYPEETTEKIVDQIPSHLVVAGYSGNDNRCVEMIKYVLDCDPNALLFWICYKERDLAYIDALFHERCYKRRIFCTVTERTDLLLYEFYQRLCLCLPPGGFGYQFTHNVPPEMTFYPESRRTKEAAPGADEIIEALPWLNRETPSDPKLGSTIKSQLVVVDGPSGVLSALRDAFEALYQKHLFSRIWLELEDYANTACLASELFTIISLRRGLFQLEHAVLVPESLCTPLQSSAMFKKRVSDWKKHINELNAYLAIHPQQLLIVLYGRNGPGGCSMWHESQYWNEVEYGKNELPGTFTAFLKALVDVGFNVIYAPYTEGRLKRDKGRKDELNKIIRNIVGDNDAKKAGDLTEHFTFPSVCHNISFLEKQLREPVSKRATAPNSAQKGCQVVSLDRVILKTETKRFDFKKSVTQVWDNWLNPESPSASGKSRSRISSTYAVTLFRQSRHYSAFLCEGVLSCPLRYNSWGEDNDIGRSKTVRDWLSSFNDWQIFYRKPGGFAWAHRDMRLALRCLIASLPKKVLERVGKIAPSEYRARTHYWIANWYMQAFHVTQHATPLMEALFQYYQCVLHAHTARKTFSAQATDKFYRYRYWRMGLIQMIKALIVGADAMRFWLGIADLKAWFSEEQNKVILGNIKKSFPDGNLDEDQSCKALYNLLRLTLQKWSQRNAAIARISPLSNVIFTSQYIFEKASSVQPNTAEKLCLETRDTKKWRKIALDLLKKSTNMPDAVDLVAKLNLTVPHVIKNTEEQAGHTQNEEKIQIQKEKLWRKLREIQEEQLSQNKPPRKIADDSTLFYMLQHSVEWAYLLVRRIKRLEHPQIRDDAYPVLKLSLSTPSIRRMWVEVCMHCATCLDIAHLVHPSLAQFEMRERAKALALYGLALGRLKRFTEAHRRLNESHALLTYSGQPSSVLFGIISLRRAEVYIIECCVAKELARLIATENPELARMACDKRSLDIAEDQHLLRKALQSLVKSKDSPSDSDRVLDALYKWLIEALEGAPTASDGTTKKFGKPDTFIERLLRIYRARADDAWNCLDSSEHLLAGKTHSSRWWARLHALRLRCFAEIYDKENRVIERDLIPQTCQFGPQRNSIWYMNEILNKGLITCSDDIYGKMRLYHYFWRAAYGFALFAKDGGSELNSLELHAQSHGNAIGSLRAEFTDKLRAAKIDPNDSLTILFTEIVLEQIDSFKKLPRTQT